ncbi:MAG: hypothetical protein DRP80_00815 [Candidatus Omnitrophota bacterium]|nr:MAG: hypothetical protein DRP80_00815 [Candidatus Omnitrophota bacterium]
MILSLSIENFSPSFLTLTNLEMSKKSLTFLEILVSALILATALGGVLASFVSVRKAVLRSDKRLAAFNIARGILEDLYKEVREDTWDTGRLNPGYTENGTIQLPPENITYNWDYAVNPVGGRDYYRQVIVNVRFPQD